MDCNYERLNGLKQGVLTEKEPSEDEIRFAPPFTRGFNYFPRFYDNPSSETDVYQILFKSADVLAIPMLMLKS